MLELGTFSPSIDRHGKIRVNFRADSRLKREMRVYEGEIQRWQRIGWIDAQFMAVWDAGHPDDTLEV